MKMTIKDEITKIKLFQQNLYTTIDLLLGLTEVYRVFKDENELQNDTLIVPFDYKDKKMFISYQKPKLKKLDALKMELQNFILSIKKQENRIVTGEDGRDALEIALKIQEKIIQDVN